MFQTRDQNDHLVIILELLSAIVKLRHLQPSCWLGTMVDFHFDGSHAKNLSLSFMIML